LSTAFAWANAGPATTNEVTPARTAATIALLKRPLVSPETRAGIDTLDVSMLIDGEIEATRPLNFVNRPPDTLDTFSCFMGRSLFYVEYEKQFFTYSIQISVLLVQNA
jgi:hypothetical protein